MSSMIYRHNNVMQKKERPKTIFDQRYDNIVSFLVDTRRVKGFSHRSFARKSGYSRCFIARTETKDRRLDSLEIFDYMKHLGLTKEEIKAKLTEWADLFVE